MTCWVPSLSGVGKSKRRAIFSRILLASMSSPNAYPFPVDPGPVRHAVTRRIWGRRDTVLLIFAGAAAEFALNRAVDWLFVTGALPRDPIGRMFHTVSYAQGIAFADATAARESLARIRAAHAHVEGARGDTIPMWAHRAVLSMLIHYSERAATLLEGPLTAVEREELYADFRRIGEGSRD